ncbi:MAG: glycosyl hydrolase [Cyclobacteriaceae bacterium]
MKNPLSYKLLFFIPLFLITFYFSTNEVLSQELQNIQTGFVTPHDTNSVWCYWYWIGDDISKEGITKDLEAMKEVGIGAAFIGNINPDEVDGPVPILSEEWWDHMVYAVNEGKRIGVDIGTFNCPGWSMSGGPWVKPEMAMRYIVFSETTVTGSKKVQLNLVQPAGEFQDTYVLAFPAVQAGTISLGKLNSNVLITPQISNQKALIDNNISTIAYFDAASSEYTIDIKSEEIIQARSIQSFPGENGFNADCELFVQIDDEYKSIKSFLFERENTNVNVGPDRYGPVAISLPDVQSNEFRLVCKQSGQKWRSNVGFSEIIISEEPVLEHFVEKKLGKMFPSPSQNWTDDFEQYFEEKFGYSPIKYLPVFAGKVVNSVEESNRFLWDLRRAVADAVAYEYVGGLREVSNENNLKLWLENYGHWGFPSEFLMYGGQSNLVSGEFWNEGSLGDNECKSASSAAHIYGKPVTSAEAFTTSQKAFLRHPALLKKRGDWSFTEGINHFVLHLYIHQPDDNRIPGVNAWFGTEFNRHNTWFKQSETWIEYLRRCQHMLQQGQYVADVCYFIGEDVPMMTGAQIPELPGGYSYDFINAEVIMERLSVKDGKFVLPDGTSYSVMVLPPNKTMRPELLAKIVELVNQGGVIFGQAPEKSPSLSNYPGCDIRVKELTKKLWGAEKEAKSGIKKFGAGYVVDDLDLPSTLETLKIYKDVKIDKNLPVLWTHRSMPGMEIYFLTNQGEEEISFEPSFKVNGLKPQLWDAVTGEIRSLNEYTLEDGRITVPLKMEAHRSWFVVFTNNTENPEKGFEKNFPELKTVQTIDSEWTIDFQNKEIGPKSPVIFKALSDWSVSENEKIKYYSGTAIYKTSFDISDIPENEELFINLGEVNVMANIKINGAEVGGVWMAPYLVNGTGYLKKGTNNIEIEVVNLWRNRLIKDKKLPEEERYTWHLVDDIRENEEPHSSGLLGPVTIQKATCINSK